jgi:hypothetical protein
MHRVQPMRLAHKAVARIGKFLPFQYSMLLARAAEFEPPNWQKKIEILSHTTITIVTVRSNHELTFQMLTLGATGPTWIWVGAPDLAWHVNNQRAHVNITIGIGLRAQPMFPHTARTMNQREVRTLSLSIHWMEEKTLSEGPACNNWNI